MLAAYRGYSVILFAPIAALGAVLLTDPGAVAPTFTGLFMEKMVGFVKLYFPVFLLGAVFGKLIELSGFSRSIVAAAIRILGRRHAIPVIVLVCALLTYGGVSLFVVAFAVYPFAAELFRQSGIPKRLIRPPWRSAPSPSPWTPCPARRRSKTSSRPASSALMPGPRPAGADRLAVHHRGRSAVFERQRRKAQLKGRVWHRSAERAGNPGRHQPAEPADRHPAVDFGRGIQPWLHPLIPQWYGASHELTLPGLACRSPPTWRRSPPSGRWKRRWCRVFCWWWRSAFAIFAAGWRKAARRRSAAQFWRR